MFFGKDGEQLVAELRDALGSMVDHLAAIATNTEGEEVEQQRVTVRASAATAADPLGVGTDLAIVELAPPLGADWLTVRLGGALDVTGQGPVWYLNQIAQGYAVAGGETWEAAEIHVPPGGKLIAMFAGGALGEVAYAWAQVKQYRPQPREWPQEPA